MMRCTTDPEYFNTIISGLAISSLGMVPKFGDQLAPGVRGNKEVLKHVIDNCPRGLPSFSRLDASCQRLIRECITLEFNFEQFVTCEALPRSLTPIREMAQVQDNEYGPS